MKLQINYKRHDPDTLLGEKLEVTYVYSSFDSREIDAIEEQVRQQIGDGLIGDIELPKEDT